MKCFFHNDKDAVATCQSCGKSLCKECASLHIPCLCNDCYNNLIETERQQSIAEENDRQMQLRDHIIDTTKEYITAILIGSACAFLIPLLMKNITGTSFDDTRILFFFMPFGWALLDYLLSFIRVGIFASLGFWFFWFFIKVILSIVVGIPAFVFQTIKFIIKLIIDIKHKRMGT